MHRNVLDLSISTSHGFRQCTIRKSYKYERIRPDKENYLILRHFYSLMRGDDAFFPFFFLPYKMVKRLVTGTCTVVVCFLIIIILINTFDDLYSPFAGKKRCLKKEGGGPEKQVIFLIGVALTETATSSLKYMHVGSGVHSCMVV